MPKKFIFDIKWGAQTSLRKQTLSLFVAVMGLLVLTFIVASFVVNRKAAEDYREKTTERAVNNVVSAIGTAIENYNYISRLIMVNERVVSFLHAEEANKSMSYEARMGMYEILNMYNDISYIESVYIFRNDKQYASTGKGAYTIDNDSPEWNRILDAGGGKVVSISGNGMMQRMDGTQSIMFARAIYDLNTQKLLGYFVMNISKNNFDETLRLQNDSDICIVDNNGVYLAGNLDMVSLYDAKNVSDEIKYKKVKFGGKRCSFVEKPAVEPFVVMCCTGSGKSDVPPETVAGLLMIFVIFAISTLLCAWYISRQITSPILALDKAMEETQSSGWMKPIEEKMPNNEIGRLAQSYNSLIQYLNELFHKLKEEEENIRKAEMSVLHEQIKPHFLYNTLGTISYMSVEEEAPRTHDALETLGSFYRNFLSKGNREIEFKRELAIVKDYLSLQKLRYGTSFEDEYDISEECLSVKVPKLMLQPLVENSIYHGVRLKGELCTIRVTAKLLDDGLHIWVYDSGIGMGSDQIEKVLSADREQTKEQGDVSIGGFGLAGTIERIRYYCNRQDVVWIRSEEGEYTEVEILIPKELF